VSEHVEGQEAVRGLLQGHRRRVDLLLVAAGAHRAPFADLLEDASRRDVPIRTARREELDRLAHGRTHGGLVAVCAPRRPDPPATLEAMLDRLDVPPLLLLLEGVEDARTLGHVLRTAEALSVHAVLLKKHLWDFDGVEVSRAASGAWDRLPIVQIERGERLLARLGRRGLRLWGALPRARRPIDAVDLAAPTVLAIGGEKRGLSRAVRDRCHGFARIPIRGTPSSLSLGHAAAIALGEAARQRRAANVASPVARETPRDGGSGSQGETPPDDGSGGPEETPPGQRT